MQKELFVGICLICVAVLCKDEILSFCLGFLLLIAYLKSMMYKKQVVQSLTLGLVGWSTLLPFVLVMCWPRVHALSIPGSAISAIITTRVSNQLINGMEKKSGDAYSEPHDNL